MTELQERVHQWITAHGGYWDELSLLTRLVEEVGELAREYNHHFGAKKKKATEGESSVEEEMGDLLFILMAMANQQGVDLEQALEGVLSKYDRRDATRWTGP